MATKTANFTANTTIDLGVMANPIFTVDGGTWGSGILKIKIDGVVMDEGYAADFYGKLYDTQGAPMKFSATMTGGSSQDIDLQVVFTKEAGRAVSH